MGKTLQQDSQRGALPTLPKNEDNFGKDVNNQYIIHSDKYTKSNGKLPLPVNHVTRNEAEKGDSLYDPETVISGAADITITTKTKSGNDKQPTENKTADRYTRDSLIAAPQEKIYVNVDSANNNLTVAVKDRAPAKRSSKKNLNGRFHFGVQWDLSFSLSNNANYFKGYDGNDQYYIWLIPSAWGKWDINKKHGLTLQIDPYAQQFGGEKVLSIEKPLIASTAPDIVTKLIKTRGIGFGIQYEYRFGKKLSLAAGADYTLLQKVLYKEELADTSTGLVTSQRIYPADKGAYDFRYMRSSVLNGNLAVNYNFNKISIGAGITRPFTNLSANDQFKVRPVNAGIYLQYRFR